MTPYLPHYWANGKKNPTENKRFSGIENHCLSGIFTIFPSIPLHIDLNLSFFLVIFPVEVRNDHDWYENECESTTSLRSRGPPCKNQFERMKSSITQSISCYVGWRLVYSDTVVCLIVYSDTIKQPLPPAVVGHIEADSSAFTSEKSKMLFTLIKQSAGERLSSALT